jgi:hypothetical protein
MAGRDVGVQGGAQIPDLERERERREGLVDPLGLVVGLVGDRLRVFAFDFGVAVSRALDGLALAIVLAGWAYGQEQEGLLVKFDGLCDLAGDETLVAGRLELLRFLEIVLLRPVALVALHKR